MASSEPAPPVPPLLKWLSRWRDSGIQEVPTFVIDVSLDVVIDDSDDGDTRMIGGWDEE